MKQLFFLVIALLAAITCRGEELTEVTIAEYGEFLLYSVLYTADADGHFKREGLKVNIVPAGGDEKVFASLIAGSAQFGVGDPTFVAIAGEKGRPGRIIFSLLQNAPTFGIAKNSKVRVVESPKDLAGYSVATYPAPSTSYSLQKKLFQLGGLEPNIIPITYGGLISALFADRVDIALEYEPNVSLAVSKGAHVVYSVSKYFPEIALTGVSVLPEYLEENPVTAQKVVNGLAEATKVLFSNPDRVVEVLARRFPEYSPDIIRNAVENSINANTFSKDGIVSKRGWQEATLLRRELGDLKSIAPYDQYVVSSFAEAAFK